MDSGSRSTGPECSDRSAHRQASYLLIELEHRSGFRVYFSRSPERMKRPVTLRSSALALTVLALVVAGARESRAEPSIEVDFAARQADARTVFTNVVTPFVNTYCTRCHGQDRQKGGINFGPALK